MSAPRRDQGPASSALVAPHWRVRLSNPDEPLYTMAVVSELLGASHQSLRRLEAALAMSSPRPSGNQRRYSTRDVERLGAAWELAERGFSPQNVARILAQDHLSSGVPGETS